MVRDNSKMRTGYYLPLATAAFWGLSVLITAAAGRLAETVSTANSAAEKVLTLKHFDASEAVHNWRIRFAADHGVADPTSLAAAVRHSPMANLLISVAIEESHGDPTAVGSDGEQGAWQVIASDWGAVPKDLHGQAKQAERIIRALLACSRGNRKTALAQYNGGTIPPTRSYRYAERVLKRAGRMQTAVNHLPPDYIILREALLVVPAKSRLL